MKNIVRLFTLGLLVILANGQTVYAEDKCFANGWDKKRFTELRQQGFVIESNEHRNQLAQQLVYCLKNPDPDVRDQIAYEAYTTWLRGSLLTDDVRVSLIEQMVALLKSTGDPMAIAHPFAALVLSELVRSDRLQAVLSAPQRNELLATVISYFSNLNDYRGYDDTLGWRHGIAHSADVFLQLAVNPALVKPQLNEIWQALATQVQAKNRHFYIYGEAKRMALPVLYVWLANQHSFDEWQTWLSQVTSPAPLDNWQQVFTDNAHLARRHNVRSFLLELYYLIDNSKNERLLELKQSVSDALKKLN